MNNNVGVIKHKFNTWKQNLDVHNSKVQFLDTLAILIGCKESIGAVLPDGRQPDVLRIDTKRRFLFIGEGKNTESPGCLETQVRLLEYLRWLSAHVSGRDGVGIFAVCFERGSDHSGWLETISMLSRETDLLYLGYGVENFGHGFNVVWFLFSSYIVG